MRPLAAVLLVWLTLGQIAAGPSEPPAEDPRQSLYATAVELYRNGQRARAAELLENAIAGAEAGRVGAAHYALLGWCRLGLSDLVAARAAFESAARLDPASAEARSGLGYVALREDALDEARAAFSLAVELNAGDADAWKGLGIALRRGGRLSEAVSALERAVAEAVRRNARVDGRYDRAQAASSSESGDSAPP
jgi:tetratricopeptide (TPR) repeat protein